MLTLKVDEHYFLTGGRGGIERPVYWSDRSVTVTAGLSHQGALQRPGSTRWLILSCALTVHEIV